MQPMAPFSSLSLFVMFRALFGKAVDRVPTNNLMLDAFQSVHPASRLHPDGNVATTNWVTNTFYEGSGCTGSVILTKAISTAFCYSTDVPTQFYTYTCSSSVITLQYYSDSACTVTVGPPHTTQPPINYCFANDIDDDGYISSNGGWDSNMYTCTTGYPTTYAMPAASGTRSVFSSADCSQASMISVQTGLQDQCYTNYDGVDYTSFIYTVPYRFDYSGVNCNPANIENTIYIDTSGVCLPADENSFATFSMSGTNAGDNGGDDNDGVGKDMLAIAIVFSFVGGVVLTAVSVFCWFKLGRKPLGEQGDNVQLK